MGQGDGRVETPREALSDNLDRDIARRRQRLAELSAAQKTDERAFSDLWTLLARARADLKRGRTQLIADSREHTTLLGELDQLLQRQARRDSAAALAPTAGDAEAHPDGFPTDIREFNPAPAAGTPTGTSEWSHPSGPPPRAHGGPPPRPTVVPALFGPRAPEPPRTLGPTAILSETDGDTVTQITPRPAILRSAAFQAQQASGRPQDPSQPPVQAPPPQAAAPAAERPTPPSRPQPVPRTAAAAPVARVVAMAVEVELGPAQAASVAFSERVSETALYVVTQAPRRVGERFPIQFTLPGHHRAIACEVEVSQVAQRVTSETVARGMLLRLLSPSAHDRAALARFVAQRDSAMLPHL